MNIPSGCELFIPSANNSVSAPQNNESYTLYASLKRAPHTLTIHRKAHLLYAIANGIRKANPAANIVYIKGDQFTIELIEAIQNGKNIEFRSKYREADLFLIDDVQFIAGKEATQEEFFHTFNKLYEEHKQIVMTSDRKPGDMVTLCLVNFYM